MRSLVRYGSTILPSSVKKWGKYREHPLSYFAKHVNAWDEQHNYPMSYLAKAAFTGKAIGGGCVILGQSEVIHEGLIKK